MLHKIKAGEYTILHYDSGIVAPAKVEKQYNAKYVGEFTLKYEYGGWANLPVAVFYQEEIPKQYKKVGSHYFGIYNRDGALYIVNAEKAANHTWIGVLDPVTKEILYSAYRHDYQVHEGLMADGGPDYTRTSSSRLVDLTIVKDKIVVEENDQT